MATIPSMLKSSQTNIFDYGFDKNLTRPLRETAANTYNEFTNPGQILEGTFNKIKSIIVSDEFVINDGVALGLRMTYKKVVLADDATIDVSLMIGFTHGLVDVMTANVAGTFFIEGGDNVATVVDDPKTSLAATDIDTKLCLFSAGSGAYTLKNRLGGPSKTIHLFYRGLP